MKSLLINSTKKKMNKLNEMISLKNPKNTLELNKSYNFEQTKRTQRHSHMDSYKP